MKSEPPKDKRVAWPFEIPKKKIVQGSNGLMKIKPKKVKKQ